MKKNIAIAGIISILLAGCSSTEVKYVPEKEVITIEDIELYQNLKECDFQTAQYERMIEDEFKKTFKNLKDKKDQYEEKMYSNEGDRFSSIIKDYKKIKYDY